jgi:hypothetical protein
MALPSQLQEMVPRELPSTSAPDFQQCNEQINRLFDLTLRHLREDRPLDVAAMSHVVRAAVRYGTADDFGLLALTRSELPLVVASFSCAMDATDFQGAFRVFAARDGQYEVVARSQDYPVLDEVDSDGSSLSAGVVSIRSAPSGTNAANLVTRWTRGGGSPAPFSLIVWNWDGQRLEPIWSRADIKRSAAAFIGPLIVIESMDPDQGDEHTSQAYRMSGQHVVFDGIVDRSLLQRYLSDKVIQPQTPDEFLATGDLFQSVGELETALTYYKLRLAAETDESSDYLYYVVADLYERLGRSAVAVDFLTQYKTRNAGHLTAEAQRDLNQRIQALNRKAVTQ